MTVVPNPQVSVGINPAVSLAVTAMISVQLAAALSRPLMAEMGVPAFTWIRMVAGAAILLVLVRPRWYGRTPKAVLAALMLGATLAFMSATLFAAVNRLPLGVVVTIAFLGPLSVSVLSARGARPLALGLALVAGVGVTLVIAPVAGSGGGWTLDPLGLVFALASALGWALYIVLTRRVGRLFTQSDGLCFSLLAAAVLLTPAGLDGLDGLERMPELSTLLAAVGLAILAPLLPCWLEMAALRRLGTQSFGILMSLEPAIATVLGMLILNETPGPQQIIGMACIILTSVAAVTLLERQMEG
jgi:inner membrane transporter RhtA